MCSFVNDIASCLELASVLGLVPEFGLGPGGLAGSIPRQEEPIHGLGVSNPEPDGNAGSPERSVVAALTTDRRIDRLEVLRSPHLVARPGRAVAGRDHAIAAGEGRTNCGG